MRYIIAVLALFISISTVAQQPLGRPLYVAAKTGLSIREKPEVGAKVLDKIPYGTKITLVEFAEESNKIVVEGMTGYWQKVVYNKKTGYIIDSYLFPLPPPKTGVVKEMKQYLTQSAPAYGAPLVVRSGNMNTIEEAGWHLIKQLYKNGAEWHRNLGYEYLSDTYFFPAFSLEQGFLLLRLIPEFKDVFSEKDEYPSESRTFTRNDIEYKWTVDKETFGEYTWIKKISLEYSDGASYMFEMYMQDNQLVISYSSGV